MVVYNKLKHHVPQLNIHCKLAMCEQSDVPWESWLLTLNLDLYYHESMLSLNLAFLHSTDDSGKHDLSTVEDDFKFDKISEGGTVVWIQL